MSATDNAHAIDNAKGHLESIRDLVARRKAAEETDDGSALADNLDQEFDEYPLSVSVRDGWRSPGKDTENEGPVEFEILLTTGGPALRLVGELDEHAQPTDCVMEWQDWGTPWTALRAVDFPYGPPSQVDADLLAFAAHFYFGD